MSIEYIIYSNKEEAFYQRHLDKTKDKYTTNWFEAKRYDTLISAIKRLLPFTLNISIGMELIIDNITKNDELFNDELISLDNREYALSKTLDNHTYLGKEFYFIYILLNRYGKVYTITNNELSMDMTNICLDLIEIIKSKKNKKYHIDIQKAINEIQIDKNPLFCV